MLMAIPGPPVIDEASQKQIEELMAKGFAGTAFLTTDDCQANTRSSATAASSSPNAEERPYGIDCGFRDPSGNSFRLTEVKLPANV